MCLSHSTFLLQWNCESQLLVIMFTNQTYACLYDAEAKSLSRIEIGLKVGVPISL